MAFSFVHGFTSVSGRLAVSLGIFILVFALAAGFSYRPRQINRLANETDLASTAPAVVPPPVSPPEVTPIEPKPDETENPSIHHEYHHARPPIIADIHGHDTGDIVAPPHLPVPAHPTVPASTVTTRSPVDVSKFVAFNKPTTLYVDEPSTVQAVLSSKSLTVGALANAFSSLPGEVTQTGSINVGAYIAAKLTAPVTLLEITAEDANLRKVEGDKDITFVWYVKPLQPGAIPIDLAIYSQDKPDAGSPVERAKVMQETWTAEAHGLSGLLYWIKAAEPVRVELWTLASGIAAVLTFFGLKKAAGKPAA